MIKEIIKCDVCERELDKNKDTHYYDIQYRNMWGWAAFVQPHPEGVRATYQVCENCIKSLIEKVKEK